MEMHTRFNSRVFHRFSILTYIFVLHLFLQLNVRALGAYRFIQRANRVIKSEYVSGQQVLRSKQECVTVCSSSSACLSASWGSLTNVCLLTDQDTVDFGVDSKYLEEADNWDTMAMIRYQVVLYYGPSGPYTLTFNAAVLHCEEEYNTTIASRADLLYARSKGFDRCNCGWLSDGTKGFVVQEDRPKCNNAFTTGIINCGSAHPLVNVYCILP